MRLRYKLLINLCIYVFGILTAVAIPIIKWSIIAPIFGRKVDIKKSIHGLALKEGIILETLSKQLIGTLDTTKHIPSVIISQEYPNSQGFNYRQSINLSTHPAVMSYQSDWQPFWLGIGNISKKLKNLNNPTIFLNFHGQIKVKVDENTSIGWAETDPNFTYFLKTKGSIQPGQRIRLNPLFVKFPKVGLYTVFYSITGDNQPPVSGNFNIKVVK